MEETKVKSALDAIVEKMDSFKSLYDLQCRVAKAMKKNVSVAFKGTITMNDYTARMAKHLVKPACQKLLAELKASYSEFAN